MKRFYVSRLSPGFYAVVDRQSGGRASADYASSRAAHERAGNLDDRHRQSGQQRLRKCLTCNDEFMSDHPGNRMCGKCRAARSGLGREMLG